MFTVIQAICFKCGADKLGPFMNCKSCGAVPKTNVEYVLSLILCNHVSSQTQLTIYAENIRAKRKLVIDTRLIAKAKEALSDPELASYLGLKPSAAKSHLPEVRIQTTSISTTVGDKKGSRETSLHKKPFWLENFVMKRFEFRVSGLTEEDAKRWDKQQRREPGQGIAAQAHALVLCAVGAAAVYFVDHSLGKPPLPPLDIVQTIPPQDSGSTAMPACAPAVFFLNRPYLGDIKHSLHVTDASGKEYDLTVDSEGLDRLSRRDRRGGAT